jgi:adenylate cyclase
MKDVFAIQSDVAKRVAEALEVQLIASVKMRIEVEPTKSQEAHSLYLKGMQHFYEYSEEGFGKAIQYFKLAADADPSYARPYVWTFVAYYSQVTAGYVRVNEVMEKALAAAFRAIELDKDSAEAHLALAGIKYAQFDLSGAEEESGIAVELNPSYTDARLLHGQCLFGLRRREEALVEMKKLVDLDPLSPDSNAMLGWILFENKQFDESIAQLKKTIEMDPFLHNSHMSLGVAYLEASRFDESISEFQKAIELSGGKELRYVGLLGEAYARGGNKQEAEKIIESLEKSSKERPIAGTITAVYLALGDLDNTFLWADKAIDEHNPGFLFNLTTAYEWDSIRSDPRFIALLKKGGVDQA